MPPRPTPPARPGRPGRARPAATVQPPSVHPGEETRPATDDTAAGVELSVSAVPLRGDERTTALDEEVRTSRPHRRCTLYVATTDGESIEACRWEGTPSTRVV